MAKPTRREATDQVTAQAMAWLWRARVCRALALEVGYDWRRLGTAWDRKWRADLVAAFGDSEWPGIQGLRLYVIEVKGSRADWRREDTGPYTKWQEPTLAAWCRPLVLCAGRALAELVRADLSEDTPWSVGYFDDLAPGRPQWVPNNREPPRVPPLVSGDDARTAALVMAEVHTAALMPAHANGRRRNQPPLHTRVAEKLAAERHKNMQLDLFLDTPAQ